MFIPKNKIQEGLYTNGGEFIFLTTGKAYVGYYYKTFENRFFTGKTISIDAEEIIDKGGNKSYKSFDAFYQQTSSGVTVPLFDASHSIVLPTEQDYTNGFMTRFLIKRVNGSTDTIMEVTESDFQNIINNPLYVTVQFKWKLTGPAQDDLSDPNMPVMGIADTNFRTLKDREKSMPGITKYLRNPLQYARIF